MGVPIGFLMGSSRLTKSPQGHSANSRRELVRIMKVMSPLIATFATVRQIPQLPLTRLMLAFYRIEAKSISNLALKLVCVSMHPQPHIKQAQTK